ncbi:hypothetical protein BDW75DRAFT_216838 [Aspergillus navahoensis]
MPLVPQTRSLPKVSKACVPCRARKVKCNATVIGLPCGSCVSRECPEECILSVRKRRNAKGHNAEPARPRSNLPAGNVPIPSPLPKQPAPDISRHTTDRTYPDHVHESIHASHTGTPFRHDSPISQDYRPPRHTQPDLLYLNILQDTVNNTATGQSDASDSKSNGGRDDSFDTQIQRWNPPLQLDDIDNEYLAKKKVFELPPPRYMDAIIKAYFDYVHPFAPILNRVEFIKSYRSGNCSLFLLHAMSTAASVYVPLEVTLGCGYADRSAAQTSLFSKAKLFHDFHCQDGSPLSMLQGSMILGAIILDHPSDRDFQYWFHNSVRCASKLGIHNACLRDGASQKLYRRIWWVLHNRDIFHFFVNTQNMRLLVNAPPIKPLTEDDWEHEDIQQGFDLLSPISHHQKASLIAHCELAQIFGKLMSVVASESTPDLHRLIQPLDTWRMSLPHKMQFDNSLPDGEIYHLEALTTSYRFECIMCRLLRRGRWQIRDASLHEWAQQRFRAATFELDTIVKRVLIDNTIQKLPTTFITTITALLALHIESALDSSESSLIRSMARISIQHTMLALEQIQDIPAIKRALPAFEMVLSKNKLYPASFRDIEQVNTMPPVSHDDTLNDGNILPSTQADLALSQDEQQLFSYGDFLGFDFLDRWQMEQLEFTGIY